jgi:hypothetical protein
LPVRVCSHDLQLRGTARVNHRVLSVAPLFATPFGVAELANSAARNATLLPLLTARASSGLEESRFPHRLTFASRCELTSCSDPIVRELLQDLVSGLITVVRSIVDCDDKRFNDLTAETRGWFSIIGPDEYVPPDNHKNAAWCVIYCVAAPERALERDNSGVLRLHEQGRGSMFLEASTCMMRVPYRVGHSNWRPVPGRLAVFPAGVTYEIAQNRATSPLVLVTVVARFMGAGQEAMPW